MRLWSKLDQRRMACGIGHDHAQAESKTARRGCVPLVHSNRVHPERMIGRHREASRVRSNAAAASGSRPIIRSGVSRHEQRTITQNFLQPGSAGPGRLRADHLAAAGPVVAAAQTSIESASWRRSDRGGDDIHETKFVVLCTRGGIGAGQDRAGTGPILGETRIRSRRWPDWWSSNDSSSTSRRRT